MPNYYVEIVNFTTKEVVKRMGPMNESRASRVEDGVLINLNYEQFFTRIVEVAEDQPQPPAVP